MSWEYWQGTLCAKKNPQNWQGNVRNDKRPIVFKLSCFGKENDKLFLNKTKTSTQKQLLCVVSVKPHVCETYLSRFFPSQLYSLSSADVSETQLIFAFFTAQVVGVEGSPQSLLSCERGQDRSFL